MPNSPTPYRLPPWFRTVHEHVLVPLIAYEHARRAGAFIGRNGLTTFDEWMPVLLETAREHGDPKVDFSPSGGLASSIRSMMVMTSQSVRQRCDRVADDIRKAIGPYIREGRSTRALVVYADKINRSVEKFPGYENDWGVLAPEDVRAIVAEEQAWWLRVGDEDYGTELEIAALDEEASA